MDNKQEYKTPVYMRRASANYRAKKENASVMLPQGTKERIKAKYGDISFNKYVNDLIERDLKQDLKQDSFVNNPFEN